MPLDAGDIVSVKYLTSGSRLVKTVIQTLYPYFDARLTVDGKTYREFYNDKEPYDRLTHVFYVCRRKIAAAKTFRFTCTEPDGEKGTLLYLDIKNKPVYEDASTLTEAYDSGIMPVSVKETVIADGVTYKRLDCADSKGQPVAAFALFVDTKKASFAVGTPDDGDAAEDCRQTVEGEALAAIANGKNIVAATNADFFDMFGNGAPSGLCVKDGKIIANADSKRPFFGVLDDGSPVISSLKDEPQLAERLRQAVAGLQRLLKDGQLYETALLEPFGYVRHPRTAVGIDGDNTVILLVVDGRIPDYSNGATLVDVARLMQSLGARDALNLDGGGSSILLIRRGRVFETMNNPADLFRPAERLIREGYNSILVVK